MDGNIQTFRRLVLENRDFRRLWLSHTISLIGDWLSYIAIAVITLDKGEGALAIGLVFLAHTIPTALVTPISGPLADRFDRRKLLLAAYLVSSVITVGMWGIAELGSVLGLQLALFVRVCISSIGITARSAAIPAIVGREELAPANALLGLTWSVMFTLGLAVGGIATEYLSPSGAILLDALTFILAATVAWKLPRLQPDLGDAPPPRPGLKEMMQAYNFAKERPRVMMMVFAKTPPLLASAGAWVTLNMVASSRLSAMSAAIALGLMQCVRAIGTGLGPLVPSSILPRHPHVGAILSMLGAAAFAGFDIAWISFTALFVWGAGQGHNWVVSTAELQAATPDHLLGRMVALDFFLFSIAQSLGALGAGWVSDYYDNPAAGSWLTVFCGLLLFAYIVFITRAKKT